MAKDTQIVVRTSTTLKAAAQKIADREKRSLAQIVELALEDYVAANAGRGRGK